MTPIAAPDLGSETRTTSLEDSAVSPTQVPPESRLRSAAESAFCDHIEQDLDRLQGEIDAMVTKAVTANFEPFRDGAENLLQILRLAFGQVARFVEGDFRQHASFYLGQLHTLAEIAEKVRQRRLPREVVDLVTRKGPSERILRSVVAHGSIGASELAKEVSVKESNLSTLCKELAARELLRSDRFGKRVRYSPTPLTYAVVAHFGEAAPTPKPATAAGVVDAALDWPKAAAAAAAASFDAGNVMANTSDFASCIFTLGVFRGAKAVVIEPPGDHVRIESNTSDRKILRLPKSVGRSLAEQMDACTVHGGTHHAEPGTHIFDWCGQRMRATAESVPGGKRYRVEFLDSPKNSESEEKIQITFQEMEQEKARLEAFLRFYAREVLYTFDGRYAPAAKTLGIRPPELKSIVK